MKFTHIAGAFALIAILSAQGHAQSIKTREQVKRELAEAIRTGDILAPGESGLTLRELHPENAMEKDAGTNIMARDAMAAADFPASTDEIRAEAAKRTATATHDASLQPFVPLDDEVVSATDTDSARRVAGQADARHSHEAYLSDVLRAGAGVKLVPIMVTDTDAARAAAGQEYSERRLLADYADYVTLQAKRKVDLSSVSKPGPAPGDVGRSQWSGDSTSGRDVRTGD